MFLQPHIYDTDGPTNLWQADSFIRSGKICNYGYPLEVSKSPIFGVQKSKSTLDDSHVFCMNCHQVPVFRLYLYGFLVPQKTKIITSSSSTHLLGRMVELIRLFTVVGVCAVIWVEQSLEVFFKDIRNVWNGIRRNSPPKITWHHISWGHGRYKASNGICRSCKRTVSRMWKWMISKERLNVPIHRGFSMTDDENPSAWISTPGGVFFKCFGISHGICDCGAFRLRYVHRGTIEFHFVWWLDISWAGSRRKSSAGVWLCLAANDDPPSREATDGKGRFFTEFLGWTFKKSTSIEVSRETGKPSGGSRFFC